MQYQRESTFLGDFFKMHEQYDSEKVISKYEKVLQQAYLTCGSFQDILDGNLNKNRRRIQMFIIIFFCVLLPRYWFTCFLYGRSEETMKYYQYMIVDYMEQLGLVGRSLNAIYACNLLPLCIDKVMIRSYETHGRLEFLTEMNSLRIKGKWSRRGPDGFDETEKRKFSSLLHKKLIVLQLFIQAAILPIHIFQIMGCIMFVYKVSRSLFASVMAIAYCVVICVVQHLAILHIYTLILAFHATTDYFAARIKSLVIRVGKLATHFTERSLSKALNEYDRLIFDFKKRNYSFRHLLCNLCYFYCPELSLVMFLFTIDMPWWMKCIILTAASSFSFAIITTELYVGRLQARVKSLYDEMNFATARAAMEIKHQITWNTRMHLQLAIRELGSRQKDGQHTVGLTNGEGAVLTTIDAVQLTLATCSFTILLMSMIYYT